MKCPICANEMVYRPLIEKHDCEGIGHYFSYFKNRYSLYLENYKIVGNEIKNYTKFYYYPSASDDYNIELYEQPYYIQPEHVSQILKKLDNIKAFL